MDVIENTRLSDYEIIYLYEFDTTKKSNFAIYCRDCFEVVYITKELAINSIVQCKDIIARHPDSKDDIRNGEMIICPKCHSSNISGEAIKEYTIISGNLFEDLYRTLNKE